MSKRTAIIKPGETFILPKGAIINSVIIDGTINVESSCDNLPVPSAYKCGYFYFICDVDDNDGHSMDEQSTHYSKVKVGGNIYVMNKDIISGDNPGTLFSVSELNTFIPDQVLFSFTAINRNVLSKKQLIRLYFKVPDSLFDELELEINNGGSFQIYRPIEADCGSYPSEP
jgi:hypothetical protein